MIDCSIECALPYVEDLDGIENTFQLALDGLVRQLGAEGKTYTRVLLVDDVTNDGGPGYDLATYIAASVGSGGPDVLVLRESMLDDLAAEIYPELATSMEPAALARLKSEKGYSSPFYIAVWSLLRLGYVTHPDFDADRVAARIVNILPEVFREGEEESMDIVRHTLYAPAAERVDYIFV